MLSAHAALLLVLAVCTVARASGDVPVLEEGVASDDPQFDALLDLYKATNGNKWNTKTGWIEYLINRDYCGVRGKKKPWFGIFCSGAKVVLLNLPGNALAGTIPASIGNLQHLETLDLSDNQLVGFLPDNAAMSNMSSLSLMDVSSNRLSGVLPSSLGKLDTVHKLVLSSNLLSGTLPAIGGNLPAMTTYDVSHNHVSGTIPESFSNMIFLINLALNNNRFVGSLPELSENLDRLEAMIVANNTIVGEIPVAYSKLTALQTLDVSGNHLSGSIPDLSSLRSLNTFLAKANKFTGVAPDWAACRPKVDCDASENSGLLCQKGCFGNHCRVPACDNCMKRACNESAMCVTSTNLCPTCHDGFCGAPASTTGGSTTTSAPTGVGARSLEQEVVIAGSAGVILCCLVVAVGTAMRYRSARHTDGYDTLSAHGTRGPRGVDPVDITTQYGTQYSHVPPDGSPRMAGSARFSAVVQSARGTPSGARATGSFGARADLMSQASEFSEHSRTSFKTASARTFSVFLGGDRITIEQEPGHGGTRRSRFSVVKSEDGEEIKSFTFVIDSKLEIVKWSELKIAGAIGQGGFGTVLRARRGHTDVAVKVLRNVVSPEQVQDFVEEASVLSDLKHPNCVLCMGVCVEPEHMSIITEFMAGGDLHTLIHGQDNQLYSTGHQMAPSWSRKLNILHEAAKGLEYLHARDIPHRDIKLRNILLDTRQPQSVKLADFGLSGLKQSNIGGGGTERYAPPEVLRGAVASKASDIYSFGIVIYEVLAGKRPDEAMLSTGAMPEEWPMDLVDLIRACMAKSPAERPTVGTVLELLEEHANVQDPTDSDSRARGMRIVDMSMITPNIEYFANLPTESPSRAGGGSRARPHTMQDPSVADRMMAAPSVNRMISMSLDAGSAELADQDPAGAAPSPQ